MNCRVQLKHRIKTGISKDSKLRPSSSRATHVIAVTSCLGASSYWASLQDFVFCTSISCIEILQPTCACIETELAKHLLVDTWHVVLKINSKAVFHTAGVLLSWKTLFLARFHVLDKFSDFLLLNENKTWLRRVGHCSAYRATNEKIVRNILP